jgi:hypothetical protein
LSEGPTAAPAARAPFSERIADAACLVFALWTLCCHVVIAFGGSLAGLIVSFVLAGAALLVLRLVLGRAAAPPPPPEFSERNPRRRRIAQSVGLVLGLVGAWAVREQPVALWWWIVLLLGAALVLLVLLEAPVFRAPGRGRAREIALWTLAFACVALTLASHRADLDDSFYVNLAVGASDAPGQPLLGRDTLHGVAGPPVFNPVYRAHSYELWNGALAFLIGIPAIQCFHWVSASLAALMVPLALARLLRLLTPRRWLWTVAAVVFVLLASGETHRWFGNFAFVRMWQGKAIFLFVFLPLVYAYAIDFALRPSRRGWILLCAAQIAAVGCSSSAIWAAPASALAATCSVLRPTRRGLRIFALAALASAYVLGVGWSLRGAVESERVQRATALSEEEAALGVEPRKRAPRGKTHEPGEELGVALHEVFGDAHLRTAAIASILVAWACCGPGLAQRFAIVVPLAVTLVVLNPYGSRWLTANLVGPSYWRSLWAIPVPLLMVLVLTAPLQLGGRWRWAGRAGALLALASFALAVPRYHSLSERNKVRIGTPELKVSDLAHRWASALNGAVAPGSIVVAPSAISVWLPTQQRHSYPLIARWMYMPRYEATLGMQDLKHRLVMTRYVDGRSERDDAPRLFRLGLKRFGVKGVCLRNFEGVEVARKILRKEGFDRTLSGLNYEIWVRK